MPVKVDGGKMTYVFTQERGGVKVKASPYDVELAYLQGDVCWVVIIGKLTPTDRASANFKATCGCHAEVSSLHGESTTDGYRPVLTFTQGPNKCEVATWENGRTPVIFHRESKPEYGSGQFEELVEVYQNWKETNVDRINRLDSGKHVTWLRLAVEARNGSENDIKRVERLMKERPEDFDKDPFVQDWWTWYRNSNGRVNGLLVDPEKRRAAEARRAEKAARARQRSVGLSPQPKTRDRATQTLLTVSLSKVKGQESVVDDMCDQESVVTAIYNPVGFLEPIVKDEGSESDQRWDQESAITAIYNPVVPQKQEAMTDLATSSDAAMAGRPAGQIPPMDARFLDFLRYMSQRRKEERIAMGLISQSPETKEGGTHQISEL